jgi:hypothetical protein
MIGIDPATCGPADIWTVIRRCAAAPIEPLKKMSQCAALWLEGRSLYLGMSSSHDPGPGRKAAAGLAIS